MKYKNKILHGNGFDRPPGVSRYMWKKFMDCFLDGCQFWTSEDGNACEFVIMRHDHWRSDLKYQHPSERLDWSKMTNRCAWVEMEWVGGDYFDGGNQKRGKVWRLTDQKTPFPVYAVEPIYKEMAIT